MALEEIRDNLLQGLKAETKKDETDYRSGYINGVLDMYNETKKSEVKELVNA